MADRRKRGKGARFSIVGSPDHPLTPDQVAELKSIVKAAVLLTYKRDVKDKSRAEPPVVDFCVGKPSTDEETEE